eukprot:TRINITY_DN14023_c0_g1_i1.p1 TRINITY_DN14023_c0_g1~~TRINITY_DN14023_c0_g1_i1.p1  ORF type:complete len:231 (-),score=54.56 TRINITY_DN14023_c0_g1_i1:112-804(-)
MCIRDRVSTQSTGKTWTTMDHPHAQDAVAHTNRGNTLHLQGDFDGAIAAYEEALRIDPEYHTAHDSRGDLLRLRGELERARDGSEKVLKEDPNNYDTLTSYAGVLQALGDLEGALWAFEKALRVRSGDEYSKSKVSELKRRIKDRGPQQTKHTRRMPVEVAKEAGAVCPGGGSSEASSEVLALRQELLDLKKESLARERAIQREIERLEQRIQDHQGDAGKSSNCSCVIA